MKYYSINKQSPPVNFEEAAISGQAPDKGLYFPSHIPTLDKSFFKSIRQLADEEIAYRVIQPYIGDAIPEKIIQQIIKETVCFPMPLKQVSEKIYSLELFHGPTLAFKDVGARFMSRCLGYFLRNERKPVTVLVATSGDTGGAVANGFYNVPGIDVVILYPKGRVSPVQEKQLTTLGGNIHALEIEGSFDDCQRMVKQAFTDTIIQNNRKLTSANSINIARWLPQQFYYFFAYKQWKEEGVDPVVCVPSGNFGNICAGLLAKASGLPSGNFIAACNANKVVPRFLTSGIWNPAPAVETLSNAMDVGDPSNFIRILELFGQQYLKVKEALMADTVSDDETIATISNVFKKKAYLLDPHGAVAWYCLEKYLSKYENRKGIILETAHPVKFPDAVLMATKQDVEIPASLRNLMEKPKVALTISADFNQLKEYLLTSL